MALFQRWGELLNQYIYQMAPIISDGTNTKKSDRNSSKIVKCQIQGRIVGYSLLY